MIFAKWNPNYLTDSFTPFPAYKDRSAWENLPQETKTYYSDLAKPLKGKLWEILPATTYMEFAINGNRSRYEAIVFKRRCDLFHLMIAECIEGKGEYIDDIINCVWATCEESTWVIPAHNRHVDNNRTFELVDIESLVYVDLFSAETGSLMSWVYYFLGDAIEDKAPLVKRRIEIEMEKRILKPYLERDDFGWMGLDHDDPVNNWNPWINSNVLIAYLVFGDKDTKIKGIEKTIISTDRFLAFYAEDGGCDEGPIYFGVAGASLLDFLEALDIATNSTVYLHNEEIIKNMARYIYRVYMGQKYYVNFADAPARVFAHSGLLYRTGLKIGDDNLVGFALYLMENGHTNKPYAANNHSTCLFRLLSTIFQKYDEVKPFVAPKSFWFDGIQVLTARDKEGSLDGMAIAAKGGNNDESHNHNDIGNFVMYYNTEPIIVDAGVETYSKKTFSDERYDIWTMQSCYHNAPTINGYDQLVGVDKKATDVVCKQGDDVTSLEMELREAYPKEADIYSYKRNLVFKHGEYLEVKDSYSLRVCHKLLVVNLLTFNAPTIEKDYIRFGPIAMAYDTNEFDVQTEEIVMTDPKIKGDWEKETLYRVVLTQKSPKTNGTFTLRFVPQ